MADVSTNFARKLKENYTTVIYATLSTTIYKHEISYKTKQRIKYCRQYQCFGSKVIVDLLDESNKHMEITTQTAD